MVEEIWVVTGGLEILMASIIFLTVGSRGQQILIVDMSSGHGVTRVVDLSEETLVRFESLMPDESSSGIISW